MADIPLPDGAWHLMLGMGSGMKHGYGIQPHAWGQPIWPAIVSRPGAAVTVHINPSWPVEDDSGDYYAGTNFYCLTCHAALPDLGMVGADSAAIERADVYSLDTYLAIRVGAARDDVETARVRELHAKAVAARKARVCL